MTAQLTTLHPSALGEHSALLPIVALLLAVLGVMAQAAFA